MAKSKKGKEYFHNITVKFNVDEKPVSFNVITNMTSLGFSIEAAVDNWIPRTKKFTAQSLCDYVCSKDVNVVCITEKEYNKL